MRPNQFLAFRFSETDEPFNSYIFWNHETGEQFKEKIIEPLSLINIFIGQNNSGKSRLLRELVKKQGFDYKTENYNFQTFCEISKSMEPFLKSAFQKAGNNISGVTYEQFFEKYSKSMDLFIPYLGKEDPLYHLQTGLNKLINNDLIRNGRIYFNQIDIESMFKTSLAKLKNYKFNLDIFKANKFYIPILRGMRPFTNSSNNFYLNRTKQDYDLPESYIFTGLELYEDLTNKLLGKPDGRKAVKDYEDFLSKYFFDGKEVTLIPLVNSDTVEVKIGDEKQYPIHQLGDGLQNLIIVTYKIFLEKERCLFFFEEPDLYMHPGMQRAFLEVLLKHNHHQYFLTTHSNHLLDMTLDYQEISVFHFQKKGDGKETKFEVKPISTGDRNLLQDLGVRNSSVFLTNATIWVEGITDRLYLRVYLEKYLQELEKEGSKLYEGFAKLKEDFHYSFIEYQGSNLVHWTFEEGSDEKINALKVCGNPLIIADGDVAGKGTRIEDLSNTLGEEKVIVLDCKEIENLIPEELLKRHKKVISEFGEKLGEIKISEYSQRKTIGIGGYLDKKLKKTNTFSDTQTGTVKNKVKFCEQIVEDARNNFDSWKLPNELKELCKNIFEHIRQANS
ncbi:MAG: hypothetical protein DWQ06_01620 [Calditrichaeota bacterium]|nr:MAG: hypothetical protein DWQ06_01620 [Calditrichota bacterium]